MCICQPTFPLINITNSRKRSRAGPVETVPVQKKRRVVVAPTKKSVRFADESANQVYNTAVSCPETWYDAQAYNTFKGNIKRDVLYLAAMCRSNNFTQMDTNEYCPYGLEKYCCSSAEQKQSKALKQQRITAVLQQQLLQKQMGYKNDESMRLMANVLSQPAVNKAIERAQRLVTK